jgi:hypothetical protein
MNQNLFYFTIEKAKGIQKELWVDVRFPTKSSANDCLEKVFMGIYPKNHTTIIRRVSMD